MNTPQTELERAYAEIESVRRIHCKNTDTAETKALLYQCGFWFTVCALVLSVYARNKPHDEWFPNVDANEIWCTHHRWFSETKTVLKWRRDIDGEFGWCYKGGDGEWYAFTNEPTD